MLGVINTLALLDFIYLTTDKPHNNAEHVCEYCCSLNVATEGSRNMCFCISKPGAIRW